MREDDIDRAINEKLMEVYGYSEKQLLAEFEAAEQMLNNHPELQEELAPPEGEFEKIMELLEKDHNEKKL